MGVNETSGVLSEDKVKELQTKFGKHWCGVEIDETLEVAIRSPKKQEWQMFTEAALTGGKAAMLAAQSLSKSCIIFPENVDQLLEEYPALYQTLMKPLAQLAGNREEARVKKY